MRWISLLLALAAAALLVVAARAQLTAGGGAGAPASGMALLADYQCRPGETRRVAVRGVEDGFSPLGDERAGRRARLEGLDIDAQARQADYDGAAPDAAVSDHFKLPPSAASAMFVMRIRPLLLNTNDGIWIGDLTTAAKGTTLGQRRRFAALLPELVRRENWRRADELWWVDLGELRTSQGSTVLADVQSGRGGGAVDVSISDDTAVDFMGMAWCERPAPGKGLTMAFLEQVRDRERTVAAFDCRDDRPGGYRCDPITGDTDCARALPLLCYRERGLGAPHAVHREQFEALPRNWSGGELAGTEPVAAARFATIGEADRFCAARFGADWRVAEWHAGGRGWGLSGAHGGRRFSGRYWIDVRGAPYGTCWKRNP